MTASNLPARPAPGGFVSHPEPFMSRRAPFVLGCVLALGSVAVAADPGAVPLKDFKWKCKFESGTDLGGYDEGEARFFFYSFGTATGAVTVPEDGEYTVGIEASCSDAEKEFAKFRVTCGETVVAKEHACTTTDKKKYTLAAKLKKGRQALVIEFLNDAFKEGEYDRNLFVYTVAVEKKK